MTDWLLWFTRLDNSKIAALLIFFSTFCGILAYVLTGRQRARRLESYKYIPLQDEPGETHDPGSATVQNNEREDDSSAS
ncbi:MAG TPA: cbb3-type cytochrome c oxidase subunit 3 [Candidatus Competibacteraceae bacterium]|nr:cbb3-type cytochrome c oxidase subunit 3 [Candidatus Competibacteraceae bacterium]